MQSDDMEGCVKMHLYGVPMLSKDPDEGCSGLWLLHILHCHTMLAPDSAWQRKLTGIY